MNGLGRRASRRYDIQVPVFFSWTESDGALRTGDGTSKNISTQGVTITSSCDPPLGKQVWIELLLPSLRNKFGLQLDGSGVVVRVDESPVNTFTVRVDFSSHSADFAEPLVKRKH